ncbi:MAG TPA: tRNA pseudouridine(55) synthase TruB [Actinomycetota bacterium]|nr:tRNA pseudouridine(55) synthase TruB [Actinomycetota bacterium]
MKSGVLVIDKPAGMTSHDVVDQMRRRFGQRRVGHGGTLDPDATGVLLVGLGTATRFLSYAQTGPKSYRAEAMLGVSTTTQDASGEVVSERPVAVGRRDVEAALKSLEGEIDQTPPMVSAVKVGGERLYRKARRGEDVARPARRVTVYDIRLHDFAEGDRPQITFTVRCSGGTFVRTLAHDLGERLGCGAHLTFLRRTEAGGFSEGEAVALDEVTEDDVRPLSDAVRPLPRVAPGPAAARAVLSGKPLPRGDLAVEEGAPVAVIAGEELLGVYVRRGDVLRADRVVPPSEAPAALRVGSP